MTPLSARAPWSGEIGAGKSGHAEEADDIALHCRLKEVLVPDTSGSPLQPPPPQNPFANNQGRRTSPLQREAGKIRPQAEFIIKTGGIPHYLTPTELFPNVRFPRKPLSLRLSWRPF